LRHAVAPLNLKEALHYGRSRFPDRYGLLEQPARSGAQQDQASIFFTRDAMAHRKALATAIKSRRFSGCGVIIAVPIGLSETYTNPLRLAGLVPARLPAAVPAGLFQRGSQ